jgi:hypothetical protein
MKGEDGNWIYQFTLKSGNRAYYNPKTEEWSVEYGYAQLIEPTIQETIEILGYIKDTAMDAWGELFNGE